MKPLSGFAWWQILVALGFVSLLAVTFWPSYGTHCGVPRVSACQSNLKQIMLGVEQYTQDYDEKFPLLNANHLPATIPPSSGWVCSLQPYLKSLQIFQCPPESKSVIGKTDYAYNSPVLAGRKKRDFKNFSATVVLNEIGETAGFAASASATRVLNRHLEGSNYAFIDGHVKWLHSTRAPLPSNVRATGGNFTCGR